MFKKSNSIEKFVFLFPFFCDFLFYYSFYITFFTKSGFNGEKLAILLVIMNVAKMVADIPIGFLSDIISRRNVLILGILCRCIFCLLCIFNINNSNFYIFCFAVFIIGVGNSSLWTQTWNYFYDYLKNKNQEMIFPVFMGKYYAISNIAIAFAAFTGEFVYSKTGFIGVFSGSMLSLFISCFIMLKMPDYKPKITIETAKNIHIANPLKFLSLIKELLKKPKITRLLILTILMDSMFFVFLDVNTTLMNYIGIKAEKISRIVGIVAFIRIFSNYFSGKVEKFMSFKRMHSYLLVLMAGSILVSFKSGVGIVLVVSIYLCIYPFFDTSIKTKLEHKLDSNTRATIMSISSLFVSFLIIFFNSLIGFIAQNNGYFASPFCIFLIVVIILFVVRNITQIYRLDLNIRKVVVKVKMNNLKK